MKRRASTVFDRRNWTIIDVIDMDEHGELTNYGPDDFFPIFHAVFTVVIEPGWNKSTQCSFLLQTWNYFTDRINPTVNAGADEAFAKLRSLFAVPVLQFNNVVYGVQPLPDDLGKRISLAKVGYKVQPFCYK